MHILATFATLCYQTQWPPNHSCTTRGQNVPFWAIFGHPPLFGHFGPFWAILGIFGPFWPFLAPPGPPAPIFGPEFPRPSPKTSPRTSPTEKKPRAHRRQENISRRTLRANVRRTFSRRTLRANSPRTTRAHKFGAQIRRTNSAHKIRANSPAHICAQIPRTQILRRVLRRKIGAEKNYLYKNISKKD